MEGKPKIEDKKGTLNVGSPSLFIILRMFCYRKFDDSHGRLC
jgi:hypothetical protein